MANKGVPTATQPAGDRSPRTAQTGRSLGSRLREFAPMVMLLLTCAIISAFEPSFLEWTNLMNIAEASAVPLVVGVALTFVVISGSIDLSIEGVLALCAIVCSLLVANSHNGMALGVWAVVVACIVGAAVGWLNGVLHARFGIPSFMATLGVWFAALGLAFVLYGGQPVVIEDKALLSRVTGDIAGVPVLALIAWTVLGLGYYVQRWTRLGRYAYAIGGDEVLAETAGIPIRRYKVLIFAAAGAVLGLAGALNVLLVGAGDTTIGNGELFQTVSAVVVGGTAITGGVGGVLNTFVGVLLITVIDNGMILGGINPLIETGVKGAVLILALAVSLDRSKIAVLK
jgi:ribose transport system permease protein